MAEEKILANFLEKVSDMKSIDSEIVKAINDGFGIWYN